MKGKACERPKLVIQAGQVINIAAFLTRSYNSETTMLDSAPIGIHADNYFGAPEFFVPADARRRHMALFGGTGTGKSTLLTNMAAADLESGSGITVVDPHGGLCEDLLSNQIPRRRKHDVIYFDPKNQQHALALNILDCPRREERGLVVSHVVSIFIRYGSTRGDAA